MGTELQTIESGMMPMTLGQSVERYNALVEFVKTVMVAEIDYGKIPGATKNTLLKPGAEKLCTRFGLTVDDPELVTDTEDFTGVNHGGEPFFNYKIRQRLSRGGIPIASQMGSCNSRESKYRYRQGERKCPKCGQAAIIRGKEEYGGGWLCWGKKNGCNAKFNAGDPSIESQQVGRVLNPDIADLANTILKMAQKRSFIAAVLVAVNASEFFTQDMEDLHIDGHEQPAKSEPPAKKETTKPAKITAEQVAELFLLGLRKGLTKAKLLSGAQAHYHVGTLDDLTVDDLANMTARLNAKPDVKPPEANGKPAEPPRKMSPVEVENLNDLLRIKGVTEQQWTEELKNFGCESVRELSQVQYEEIVARIQKLPDATPKEVPVESAVGEEEIPY